MLFKILAKEKKHLLLLEQCIQNYCYNLALNLPATNTPLIEMFDVYVFSNTPHPYEMPKKKVNQKYLHQSTSIYLIYF